MVNIDLFWLLYKIQSPALEDSIPQPHFPKHLRTPMETFPMDQTRIDKMSKFYGLLKWPFIHPQDEKMLKNKLI